MLFSLKQEILISDYRIGATTLGRQWTIIAFVVIIDQNLSFIPHIDNVVAAASKLHWSIVRNNAEFRYTTLKTLYYAHVRSKLEYADIIWGTTSDANANFSGIYLIKCSLCRNWNTAGYKIYCLTKKPHIPV